MELNETVWMVLQGLGVILAVGVTVYVMAMLKVNHASAAKQYLALDARLAAFGQTPYGQAAHNAYQQARERVDSPDDPLIQRIMGISLLKELAAKKVITAQQLSSGIVFLLDLSGGLLDGEVDTTLPENTITLTVPESMRGQGVAKVQDWMQKMLNESEQPQGAVNFTTGGETIPG